MISSPTLERISFLFPPSLSVPHFFFLKNKLEAIPMINYQLPNALPLANSGKAMNYPEKHPKREPTMKESQKSYLAVSTDSYS